MGNELPPARYAANAGPDQDGWTYYVLATGIGRRWTVESLRRRNVGENIVSHRIFLRECDGPFAAGREFEASLQLFRDYVIERRERGWP